MPPEPADKMSAPHFRTRSQTAEQRVDAAFQLVTARLPNPEERAVLLAGLMRAQTKYAAAPDDAKRFLAIGESKRDATLDPVEHAAWTALCLTVLNLDEALTKE